MNLSNTPILPLPEAISELAQFRRSAAHLQMLQREELDRVRQSEYYRELEEELADVNRVIAELEREARECGLAVFIQTGDKHPHPAITVKTITRIDYDLNEATVWARQNLPEAIHLDTRFFEKHVKAVQATHPVPCAKIIFEPQAQIASDLSKWEHMASVDDTKGYDAEIEY